MTKITPTLIIDTREQCPLLFNQLDYESGTLKTGDYSIKGLEHLFAVERKSISDLVQSVTSGRKRFENELHRLRGFRFKRLLVVGNEDDVLNHNYRSKASPKSILHSLYAFECRYNVPVVFSGNEVNAARLIERWAYWYSREVHKAASALTGNGKGE